MHIRLLACTSTIDRRRYSCHSHVIHSLQIARWQTSNRNEHTQKKKWCDYWTLNPFGNWIRNYTAVISILMLIRKSILLSAVGGVGVSWCGLSVKRYHSNGALCHLRLSRIQIHIGCVFSKSIRMYYCGKLAVGVGYELAQAPIDGNGHFVCHRSITKIVCVYAAWKQQSEPSTNKYLWIGNCHGRH